MFLNDTVAAAHHVQVPQQTSPHNKPSAKSSNRQAMTLTYFSDDILHQIYLLLYPHYSEFEKLFPSE
jgi:hypothetical protein